MTKPKGVYMTKFQLFEAMNWVKELAGEDKEVNKSVYALATMATEALGFTCTPYHIRSIVKEFGISVKTNKSAVAKEHELLLRIKRIEKFLAKNFAEEWADTIL